MLNDLFVSFLSNLCFFALYFALSYKHHVFDINFSAPPNLSYWFSEEIGFYATMNFGRKNVFVPPQEQKWYRLNLAHIIFIIKSPLTMKKGNIEECRHHLTIFLLSWEGAVHLLCNTNLVVHCPSELTLVTWICQLRRRWWPFLREM